MGTTYRSVTLVSKICNVTGLSDVVKSGGLSGINQVGNGDATLHSNYLNFTQILEFHTKCPNSRHNEECAAIVCVRIPVRL
jgi:hypothetical protein